MSIYRTAWIPAPAPCAPWIDRALPIAVSVLGYTVAGVSFAAAIALVEAGCGGAQPTPTQEAGVAAYAAEQEACITTAKTLEESQACRLAVRQKWGRK